MVRLAQHRDAAPFLLRGDVKQADRGIAGRDCASFGMPGWVRLAAPAPADLDRVLEAIRA